MINLSELTFNERKEIFQLRKYKSDLKFLLTVLRKHSEIFISHERKNSLINSLKFCDKYSLKITEINIKYTIEIISKSNKIPLDSIFRSQLFKQITKLMKYFQDFERVIPKNDTERFYLMLEGRFLFKKYLQDLLNYGIVSVSGLTSNKKLKLSGPLLPEEFYSLVTSCWEFKNPSIYFLYSQVDHPSIIFETE